MHGSEGKRLRSKDGGEREMARGRGGERAKDECEEFWAFLPLRLEDYATTYRATRDAYLKAANELKLATGPYKAARDAYVAATATYTKSLYE
jgi:hypothetical protein